MRYISTRGEAPALSFCDAVLAGLARDGGLYLPESWPVLSQDRIASFAGMPFDEVAVEVLKPFVDGEIGDADLRAMAKSAYATFGHPAVTPVVQIAPNTFVLELFHGPTLAFKDVAMQLLAKLMDHILARRGERATIVGATSGDTGGAAIEAFRSSSRVDMVILYPQGRVSDVQRRMMTTPTEPNVHAVAVEGTFDDCQALVKAMFNHHAFRDRVKLSGVNSINWGRIVAQVTYYFAAAVALGAPARAVTFAVPTGNFGDIFAGFVARKMGLPIERLIIGTNSNDILARAVETGVYEMRAVMATTSPSMDIQISSNFERFLFEANGRDAAQIRGQMAALAQGRRFDLGPAQHAALKDGFAAVRGSEPEIADEIRRVRDASGYVLETHTACASLAFAKGTAGDAPCVILATAHPAKFPDAMEEITGVRPALPPRLASLMTDPERTVLLPNDLAAVERFVEANARTVRGAAA
jgi:threonine synthase